MSEALARSWRLLLSVAVAAACPLLVVGGCHKFAPEPCAHTAWTDDDGVLRMRTYFGEDCLQLSASIRRLASVRLVDDRAGHLRGAAEVIERLHNGDKELRKTRTDFTVGDRSVTLHPQEVEAHEDLLARREDGGFGGLLFCENSTTIVDPRLRSFHQIIEKIRRGDRALLTGPETTLYERVMPAWRIMEGLRTKGVAAEWVTLPTGYPGIVPVEAAVGANKRGNVEVTPRTAPPRKVDLESVCLMPFYGEPIVYRKSLKLDRP